jgi:hypothetical protein
LAAVVAATTKISSRLSGTKAIVFKGFMGIPVLGY